LGDGRGSITTVREISLPGRVTRAGRHCSRNKGGDWRTDTCL
jgi:hypothetical protein